MRRMEKERKVREGKDKEKYLNTIGNGIPKTEEKNTKKSKSCKNYSKPREQGKKVHTKESGRGPCAESQKEHKTKM